jgi:uncharacterized cupredoxin-like copper-binding protein
MKRHLLSRMAIGAATTVLLGVGSASAATAVKIELQDSSTGDGIKAMQMKLDHDSVPAGQVRFEAVNESKSLIHEMILAKPDQDPSTFPYDAKLKSLGEVAELKPGKSGHLSLRLKPASYVLYCNQAGHAHGGMWARFTVTK